MVDRDGRVVLTGVEAVPVDVEGAPDVWLVVGTVVDRVAVDLDGAVVAPGRVGAATGRGDPCCREDSDDENCDTTQRPAHSSLLGVTRLVTRLTAVVPTDRRS